MWLRRRFGAFAEMAQLGAPPALPPNKKLSCCCSSLTSCPFLANCHFSPALTFHFLMIEMAMPSLQEVEVSARGYDGSSLVPGSQQLLNEWAFLSVLIFPLPSLEKTWQSKIRGRNYNLVYHGYLSENQLWTSRSLG